MGGLASTDELEGEMKGVFSGLIIFMLFAGVFSSPAKAFTQRLQLGADIFGKTVGHQGPTDKHGCHRGPDGRIHCH